MAGAQLKDMDNIQLMPIWGGRLLDYVGGDIFLDHEGRRFVNEGASWKTLENALLKLPNQTMWVVTDAQSKKGISLGVKLADGTVRKSDTIAEMAIGMGVDPTVLQKTLDDYNRGAAKHEDPQFGKPPLRNRSISRHTIGEKSNFSFIPHSVASRLMSAQRCSMTITNRSQVFTQQGKQWAESLGRAV